jgi:hypothetical protein
MLDSKEIDIMNHISKPIPTSSPKWNPNSRNKFMPKQSVLPQILLTQPSEPSGFLELPKLKNRRKISCIPIGSLTTVPNVFKSTNTPVNNIREEIKFPD